MKKIFLTLLSGTMLLTANENIDRYMEEIHQIDMEKKYLFQKMKLLQDRERNLIKMIHNNSKIEYDRQRKFNDYYYYMKPYYEEPRRMEQEEYDKLRNDWFFNFKNSFDDRVHQGLVKKIHKDMIRINKQVDKNKSKFIKKEDLKNEYKIHIKVDSEKDLKYSIENHILTINIEKNVKKEGFSSFNSSIFIETLPKNVDTKSIKSIFNTKDKIYTLTFKKIAKI